MIATIQLQNLTDTLKDLLFPNAAPPNWVPQSLAAPSIGLLQPQGTLIYFFFITHLFRTICKNESCNILSFVTAFIE